MKKRNIKRNHNFCENNYGGSEMNNKVLHNENEETIEVVLEQSCKEKYIRKRIIVTDDYVEFIGFPLCEDVSEISIHKAIGTNKIIICLSNKEDDILHYFKLVSLLYVVLKRKMNFLLKKLIARIFR